MDKTTRRFIPTTSKLEKVIENDEDIEEKMRRFNKVHDTINKV